MLNTNQDDPLSTATLREDIRVGETYFHASRQINNQLWYLYGGHNHWSGSELQEFAELGRVSEVHNLIKKYSHILLASLNGRANTISVTAQQPQDAALAETLNAAIQHVFRDNQWETIQDSLKLEACLTGLMCLYIAPEETGIKDRWGRSIYDIKLEYVPSYQIIIDPASSKPDYSDATFQHRFNWVSRKALRKQFPDMKDVIDNKLSAFNNALDIEDSYFEFRFQEFLSGVGNNDMVLLIHSVKEDDEGKMWSVFWSGTEVLEKKEITYRGVKFPYRIQRINLNSFPAEYYGPIREIMDTQKNVNLAINKIWTSSQNTKVFVNEDADIDLVRLQQSINSNSQITVVKDINAIKVDKNNVDLTQAFLTIQNAEERCQGILGINPAFLGTNYASESGRKTTIQQDASIELLRTLFSPVEEFYRLVARDISELIKQFYFAERALTLVDPQGVAFHSFINQPELNQNGDFRLEARLDPESGEQVKSDTGQLVYQPIPIEETEIYFAPTRVTIDTVQLDSSTAREQQLLDGVLNGQLGQLLLQKTPVAYLELAAGLLRSYKNTKTNAAADALMRSAQEFKDKNISAEDVDVSSPSRQKQRDNQ